ncbi:hypothetical protein [Empedobacter brevis]|uniref:hypothetical protein n=1 Tax=Empedobacter brevis TaxID=247 RepID=UPI00333EA546
MGLFIYLNDNDIQRLRYTLFEVEHDVAELFREALEYDKSLLIHARTFNIHKRFIFWRYKTNEMRTEYTVYHENNLEAQQMSCASGSKKVVMAYLFGIINGLLHSKKLK